MPLNCIHNLNTPPSQCASEETAEKVTPCRRSPLPARPNMMNILNGMT